MDFTQDRKSNSLFGLHDSRIKEIRFQNGVLTLEPHKILSIYGRGGKSIFRKTCVF